MAETTKISWADATFNAWIGCHKVSAACARCYAEADQDNFRGRVKWGVHGTRSVTSYSYWRQAIKWNRESEASGKRKKVFCSSLSDVFEKWEGQVIDHKQNPLWWKDEMGCGYCDVEGVPTFSHQTKKNDEDFPLTLDIIRKYLFSMIECTPNLDWLLLTKRPENVMDMVPDHWKDGFPDNVWMGTSLENQKEDWRVDYLLKIPARIRFLSCEPLLSSVDLKLKKSKPTGTPGISWVICGGESGTGARPMHIDWARSLRDQCKEADVPFLFKQWGEWIPVDQPHKQDEIKSRSKNERWMNIEGGHGFHGEEVWRMRKVGKKKSGNKIDGTEHSEFPK